MYTGPRGWSLGAWAGNSKKQGSDEEALAKGSEEKVLAVFPTLMLTFERVIRFLAVLRSSCGNLRGWCKAEYFFLSLCSLFSFDESLDIQNSPPLLILLSNLIPAFKMGSRKKRRKGQLICMFQSFPWEHTEPLLWGDCERDPGCD